MRARSLLAWFSPLLVHTSAVPRHLSPLPAPTATATPAINRFEFTPGSNEALLSFDVARENNADFLHFALRVTRTTTPTKCDDLQLAVNGENLRQHWTYDKFSHASSPSTRITFVAEGVDGQQARSVSLQSSTFCTHHDGPLEEVKIVKATTFQIVAIDDQPAIAHFPSFTTTFVASSFSLDGDVNYLVTSEPLSDYGRSDSRDGLGLADLNIEDEIARLYQLDEELKGLENMLEGQKALVVNLSKANTIGSKPELRECTSLGCVLKTLYMKLRFMLIQLRYNLDSASLHNDTHPITETKVSPPVSIPSSSISYSRTRIIFTTLDIVTCFLCLSCITIYLHSRVCDPRRCAERAAQQEERRNRRAYRNLARKQAWKNWWNRRLMRNEDAVRVRDYEEKRSMILAQEAVLETVMQQEIRQLREVEEGRTSGSVSESDSGQGESSSSVRLSRTRTYSRPPTYRSRASSGRPPSYNEVDSSRRGVLNGFRGYTPSGTIATPSSTDCTPDSSVISLSPRHSSETLRTDLSAL